jgi:hypothetical protein
VASSDLTSRSGAMYDALIRWMDLAVAMIAATFLWFCYLGLMPDGVTLVHVVAGVLLGWIPGVVYWTLLKPPTRKRAAMTAGTAFFALFYGVDLWHQVELQRHPHAAMRFVRQQFLRPTEAISYRIEGEPGWDAWGKVHFSTPHATGEIVLHDGPLRFLWGVPSLGRWCDFSIRVDTKGLSWDTINKDLPGFLRSQGISEEVIRHFPPRLEEDPTIFGWYYDWYYGFPKAGVWWDKGETLKIWYMALH